MKTFSRVCSAALICTSAALAGPPLTTIQDTLDKVDSTRFNGIATTAWSGFEASDQSAIANQIITVKIVNGRLNMQLVPTPAAIAARFILSLTTATPGCSSARRGLFRQALRRETWVCLRPM